MVAIRKVSISLDSAVISKSPSDKNKISHLKKKLQAAVDLIMRLKLPHTFHERTN